MDTSDRKSMIKDVIRPINLSANSLIYPFGGIFFRRNVRPTKEYVRNYEQILQNKANFTKCPNGLKYSKNKE